MSGNSTTQTVPEVWEILHSSPHKWACHGDSGRDVTDGNRSPFVNGN